MVFKPINLARQGLVKTFTHNYAQSLLAASQTSSASQNTFFSFQNNVSHVFGKSGPPTVFQNAFPNHSSSAGSGADSGSGAGAKAGHGSSDVSGGDVGLAAYYAAWQKHQKNDEKDKDKDGDWHQFQFAKRIGWKAPTTIPEPYTKQTSETEANAPSARALLVRTQSASVLEDTRKTQQHDVISTSEQSEKVREQRIAVAEQEEVSEEVLVLASESIARAASPQTSRTEDANSLWTATDATMVSDADHYTEHLTHLAETQQYDGVPPTFEAMLLAGVQPTTSAYNALLLAAINIPRGKHQVVPKVLDVYSDMLRRKVSPDTATYAILLELLSARAMETTSMKKDLTTRGARFGGMESRKSFLFASDQTEQDILNEDDSLSFAIKLFDTSAAVATRHLFSAETYRLLISACAEQGRVGDMVRIFADMESQRISPPTSIFAPMIQAFAGVGDLKSAVDCYNEYKTLAGLHDSGRIFIVRKDEEVYAAVVKAYVICGRTKDGLKFFGKVQDVLAANPIMRSIQDAVGMQALLPQMLAQDRHTEALIYATENLTSSARSQAVSLICCDAADKNNVIAASEAFSALVTSSAVDMQVPAVAMLAMQIRNAEMQAARAVWTDFIRSAPRVSNIEPTTMYALSLIVAGAEEGSFAEIREMFGRIRSSSSNKQNRMEITERIDEAIELIGIQMTKSACSPSAYVTLLKMMVENGGLTPVAEALLARLGAAEITTLPMTDLTMIAQIEAELLTSGPVLDVAHAARFAHIVEILISGNVYVEGVAHNYMIKALSKIQRLDLVTRLQDGPLALNQAPPSPPYSQLYSPISTVASLPVEDNFDPYGASTDFKGSAVIVEELEKTQGRFGDHLNEALSRFKNIRRAGRHPRYTTYAKLITSAAKDGRTELASEVLAIAQQDIPLILSNRIVRQGWTNIYDAMVAACLTLNNRTLASRYHQELLNLGAAPSANTFGLYITTLTSTHSTLDEATTAIQIFQRAKAEGVNPSSFLYNALIGKLGKARRIDDTLFYFAEMRAAGITPTSVTYGTVVNALCRVSDDKFAEELFEEMESMPNYKPRPAPYNSLMQHFLTTKRDRSKVLAYYNRMQAMAIQPTMHTYKLLIDAHASLEPIDMAAAEAVLSDMKAAGLEPEAVHYASLIHARGCVQHDLASARNLFDSVLADAKVAPSAPLYQALFESIVANHAVSAEVVGPLLQDMNQRGVRMTAYIANTLIHGWAELQSEDGLRRAWKVYEELGRSAREPSTYEAMTRACLGCGEVGGARRVVGEALGRGFPDAVVGRIAELVGA